MADSKTSLSDMMEGWDETFGKMRATLRRLEGGPEGPAWQWAELPDGRAILVSVDGEILMIAERMPKDHVARAIAAAPDFRKEKFGILFDRRYFQEDAPKRIRRALEGTSALLFLDLDGFKAINDRFGHGVGDDVLRIFFSAAGNLSSPRSQAYGWGGDEVVVLIPGATLEDAQAAAKQIEDDIAARIRAHPVLGPAGAAVGVSAGVHVFNNSASLDEVIKKSDADMYLAKQARKGLNR